MKQIVAFNLNGSPVEVLVKPSDTLLDVLREQLRVMGPKRGCDSGDCGTCTVLIDGEPVRSCLTIAMTVAGKEIGTIEGLGKDGEMDPLQKAFHEHGASQCGFCTPGMIIAGKALLEKTPDPSREEIVEYMSGNLCRCGTYVQVIEAIESVASDKGKE